MSRLSQIAAITACLVATGCGSAHMTRQDAHAGQIQLEGAFMPAMDEARTIAVEYCGGRVQLIEAGEGTRHVSFACAEANNGAPLTAIATR